MSRKGIPGLLLAMLLAAGNASADDSLWLGVRAGTLGLGVEGMWKPLPWVDFRLGANRYDYSDSGSQAGINYDAELRLDSFYGTANLRFPLSPLRLSVGAFSNNNEIVMLSRDSQAFNVGGTVYSAADVGSLQSTTSFDSTSPYLGIGFDFDLFDKVGLTLDFGVLWQGDPRVSLSADGLLASDPTFLAALEAERQELEDEVDSFKAWPVLSIGFNFSFL
ncbi:MAG: hypothetical protein OEW35_10065 [Gammaproteobacteria bacterium]|nr:hypothetical protein [Gammaproteobacteria bacterium]MDH5311937.1 hypothetical protein [Gammaproteobacteria bacterium]